MRRRSRPCYEIRGDKLILRLFVGGRRLGSGSEGVFRQLFDVECFQGRKRPLHVEERDDFGAVGGHDESAFARF